MLLGEEPAQTQKGLNQAVIAQGFRLAARRAFRSLDEILKRPVSLEGLAATLGRGFLSGRFLVALRSRERARRSIGARSSWGR